MNYYRIIFSIVLCLVLWPMKGWSTEVADSMRVELNDVMIEAPKVTVYADHDEMTLSPGNANFGANALDAVSSLPTFISQIAADELLNLKGEPVKIVINGRFATLDDLKAYSGTEIKKVKYYPFSPAKYLAYTSGPVAEIEIRRPSDAYYNLRLTSSNSFESTSSHPLTYAINSDQANFTYMDKTNMFRAVYTFSNVSQKNLPGEILYDYGDITKCYDATQRTKSVLNHSVTLNYQRDTEKSLFSAIASYLSIPHSTRFNAMDMSLTQGSDELLGNRQSATRNDENTLNAGLFYDYQFDTSTKFMADLQASYTWANSAEQLSIDAPGSQSFSQNTDTRNRVFTGTLNLDFNKELGAGTFDLNGVFMMQNINQNYNLLKMPRGESYDINIFPSYSLNLEKWSMTFSAGYGYRYNKVADGKSQTTNTPTGRIAVGYKISKSLSLRGNVSIGSIYKTLSSMYDNPYYDDENYIQQANFYLKPVKNIGGNIELTYMSPDGKLQAGTSLGLQYDQDAFYQFIIQEDGKYVQTTLNADYSSMLTNRYYVQYYPVYWCQLYVSPIIKYSRNPHTVGNRMEFAGHTRFDFNGRVNFFYRNFVLSGSIMTGSKSYQGDMTTITPLTTDATLSWRVSDFTLSLKWAHNYMRSTTVMQADDFRWEQTLPSWQPDMLTLNVTYTFQHGLVKYRNQKSVTVGRDNGLLR